MVWAVYVLTGTGSALSHTPLYTDSPTDITQLAGVVLLAETSARRKHLVALPLAKTCYTNVTSKSYEMFV
jgi:hypothetical protein